MSPARSAAPQARSEPRPERFVFLLLDKFTMIAFAGAIEPLRIANRVAGRTIYEWRVVGETSGQVAASNGVEVACEGGLAETGGAETIIVVGGIDVKRAITKPVLTWLRRE